MKIRSTEDCVAGLNADSPREGLRRFENEEHDDPVTEFELDNNEVSALICEYRLSRRIDVSKRSRLARFTVFIFLV